MKCRVESSDDKEMLMLSGELIIGYAAELKKLLIQTLDRSDHIHIKLEEVTEIDLTCLQLFCSAHRTAMKSNKQLTLDSNASELFKQIVADAGFLRHRGCKLDNNKTCLWIGGNIHE